MKLKTARVTNFKCIDDSGEMKVDQVTCLVGKNESGKTSLLQALYRFKPIEAKPYSKEDDYPRRHLLDYDARHPDPKQPAQVVVTTWELEQDDREALRELVGPAAAYSMGPMTLAKGYGTGYSSWSYAFDETAALAHLVATSGLHEEERKVLSQAKTLPKLKEALTALGPDAAPRHAALTETLAEFGPSTTARGAAGQLIFERIPSFVYFSNYDRMSGRVHLDSLRDRIAKKVALTEGERVFLDFCKFAGTTLDELADIAKFENLIARFEGASSKITKQIFKYWSQNRSLRVLFSRDAALPGDPPPFNTGSVFNVRIRNDLHDVSVPFDERSTGFVWFFSFLVYFSQVQKTHGDNLIILLDEPGLSLHARAQRDLLRFIDTELAPKHQVIYTTHSPFMVPSDIMQARTVEDVTKEKDGDLEIHGTKVSGDVLSTDADTIFPLQAALGYEITQALFVGEHTLLVEGPSDLLYLRAFSEELKSKGRTPLDPRWVICPVGGIDKVGAFSSLFAGNRLHVAVLVDYASGQKGKVEALRRSELLRSGHVFTAETYAGQSEADTEDIIGAVNYVDLVNLCYGPITTKVAAAPSNTPRIVKYVEDQFRTLTNAPEFDHFTPASFLIEKRPQAFTLMHDAPAALGRFEKLFTDLNALLPSKV